MRILADYILRLFPALLLAAGVAFAQPPVPFPDEVEDEQRDTELPERALTVAEDYLEVMRQLQLKINDYVEYFSDLEGVDKSSVLKQLRRFNTELKSGEYSSSCGYLITDLSQLLAELQLEEKGLKQSDREREQKVGKLILGLRLELAALSQLLAEEISEELEECSAHQEAISAYLEAALRSREQVSQRMAKAYAPLVESLPPVPRPPSARPLPPVAPAGMSGSKKTLSQSVGASGKAQPVIVSSQAGDVIITGSYSDVIAARLDIEVSAVSREKEKAFANGARLNVERMGGAYEITVLLPELADPNTRLLTSRLTVEMPSHFPVECQNAFGTVVLTDLDGEVVVTGDHSSINLSDIKGPIEVVNNLGPVAIANVTADAVITNSYASISVVNSSGNLELNNRYGPVTLLNSAGEVQLTNSGPVTVRDHKGPVRIDNSNGLVEVSGIEGDVWAFNSYRPLVVTDVVGSVRLENANASIRIVDIVGQLEVSNRFGTIDAVSFGGPIEINNESGPVILRPSDRLEGRSYVTTADGMISLFVTDDTDLEVDIETLEGTIITTLPVQLNRDGDLETGTMTFGSGSGRMSLNGVGSAIFVKREE